MRTSALAAPSFREEELELGLELGAAAELALMRPIASLVVVLRSDLAAPMAAPSPLVRSAVIIAVLKADYYTMACEAAACSAIVRSRAAASPR